MPLYYAQTESGNIIALGDCSSFDEADEKAHEAGLDAIWLFDHDALVEHRNKINEVLDKQEQPMYDDITMLGESAAD